MTCRLCEARSIPELGTNNKDYAKMANDFYKKFKIEKLPAVKYPNSGQIAVYEPKSNTFGLYDKNGRTITFYKPTSKTYFIRQTASVVLRGGKIINPISNSAINASPHATQNNAPSNSRGIGVRGGGSARGGGGVFIQTPKTPKTPIIF